MASIHFLLFCLAGFSCFSVLLFNFVLGEVARTEGRNKGMGDDWDWNA